MSKAIDLNLINTFIVVTECLSYTKAADKLGVTQPAISASIKRLERTTNTKLFTKRGRNIELTSTAQKWLPQLQQALSVIDSVITQPAPYNVYCSNIYPAQQSKLENVFFHESTLSENHLFSLLYSNEADLLLGDIESREASIIVEDVCREPCVVICRNGHPRIDDHISTEMLSDEKHLGLIVKSNNIDSIASNYLGILTHVAQSDCIGVIPLSLAKKWGKTFNIKHFASPFGACFIQYQIAYHQRKVNCKRHGAMRALIKSKY
ncbi:LysR family transcriptional regulator [Vibrio parahaemolyticus]|uniref:LysR family transcriptional regulator n=1 Tax=Vibrio parahaemolyticus TaxID=670 RepID=UPI002153181D|nr:LysR family transcriptional regulator [Vibrio parahaemolyticus]